MRNRRPRGRKRSIHRILRLLDESRLREQETPRKLAQAAMATRNQELQDSLVKTLGLLTQEWQQYPFSDPSHLGEIQLGTTKNGHPVRLQPDELTRHLLTIGQSGAGKTTFFYQLMQELDVPFWSFDLKQDYRHLVSEVDLLVLPWRRLRFNPLKPPTGVSPLQWAQVFSEIFGHATALLSGSKNYLLKFVLDLYDHYDLFQSVEEPYPSLHELYELVDHEKVNYVSKTSNYRDTLLNRLESMTMAAGTIFDCSSGYSVEELLQRNVVFEFDGLSRDTQNFLMEILFAYVYQFRLAADHRNQGLNHVFFLDEAKRVFSAYKEQQDAAGLPEIDALTAKMREFGEGLVVADQEATKLTDSVKANTYTKLLLQTGDQQQFQSITETMQLSTNQKRFAQQLDVGEGVIQIGNRNPVFIQMSDVDIEKEVSDEMLRSEMADQWMELTHSSRETTPAFEEIIAPGRSNDRSEPEIPDGPLDAPVVSEDGDHMLEDIVENQFKPVTERYDRFSSTYKGNQAKDELLEKGLVVERQVKHGEHSRKLLELSHFGRQYVDEELDVDPDREGRGNIVHRYWQHRIKNIFEEAGWYAFVEKFDADVYVNMGSMELVVEVAMGDNPREIDHVEQHLETGFTVWVACRNEAVRDGLRERFEQTGVRDDQVVFRLFREFSDDEILPG